MTSIYLAQSKLKVLIGSRVYFRRFNKTTKRRKKNRNEEIMIKDMRHKRLQWVNNTVFSFPSLSCNIGKKRRGKNIIFILGCMQKTLSTCLEKRSDVSSVTLDMFDACVRFDLACLLESCSTGQTYL